MSWWREALDSAAEVAAEEGWDVAERAERLGAGWAEATAAAEAEVVAWRREHPRPTLAELERVTAGVAQRLQRRLLEELAAEATEATEAAGAAPEERPRCPRCRTPMERRGRKVREVLVAHQRDPLRLERAYYACPACQAGLSPPG